ncbi:AHH domain-containing protein [Pseudomonas promysalinigenes]
MHRGSHAQYTSAVERKLDIIHEYVKKNGWNNTDYKKAIHQLMMDERRWLGAGKTMLNKNSVRGAVCG